MHRVLERQLKRHNIDKENLPQEYKELLESVSQTYTHADEDRKLIERSMDVSSEELEELNASLKESLKFQRNVFDNLFDPLYVKDSDHKFILVNNAFCELIQHERESIIGKTDYDILSKEQADIQWKEDEDVYATGNMLNREDTFTSSEGANRIAILQKSLYVDPDGKKFLIVLLRDVTERKQKDLELEKQTKNLERLNSLMIGRELKMIELKDKLKQLEQRTGSTPTNEHTDLG